jgi:hypothetical protein
MLLLVWLSSYSLASANTTCCQVLAISVLLRHSLDHLSVSPHHMLGCGDLDLLSGSPRSPPGDPSPLRLPSPNGVGRRRLELRCALKLMLLTVVACWLRLNALQLSGCHLSDHTQYLTAACGLGLFGVCLWWWHMLGNCACSRFG